MSSQQISDKYGKNYLAIESDGSINTNAVLTPSTDFPVEIKNASDDTRAVVKTDGAQNALVVLDAINNSLIGGTYDYISLSYTGSDLTGVVFKRGGSSGTTVSTLTLAYSSRNLVSMTKT